MRPLTDRLVDYCDVALGKQFLDIAESEGEPAGQPNGVRERWMAKNTVPT